MSKIAINVSKMATGEGQLGAFVPNLVAGAALSAVNNSFMTLYLRTPGMHWEGIAGTIGGCLTFVKDSRIPGLRVAQMLADSGRNKFKATARASWETSGGK